MCQIANFNYNNFIIPTNADVYLFSIFITKDKIESIIQQFLIETGKYRSYWIQ